MLPFGVRFRSTPDDVQHLFPYRRRLIFCWRPSRALNWVSDAVPAQNDCGVASNCLLRVLCISGRDRATYPRNALLPQQQARRLLSQEHIQREFFFLGGR